MLLLLIPIPFILIWALLLTSVYQGREKTTEGIVSFLNKVCEVEFEKYIE